MRQIVTFVFQITPQNIAESKRAKIADVREAPNRRTADVKPHIIVLKGLKFFRPVGQCVVKFKHKFKILSVKKL
jgi:hypothetical protein